MKMNIKNVEEINDQITKLISLESEENINKEENINENEFNKYTIIQYKNKIINKNREINEKYVKVPNKKKIMIEKYSKIKNRW